MGSGPSRGPFQALAQRHGANEFVDLDRRIQPFDGYRTQGLDLHVTLGEGRVSAEIRIDLDGRLFHAGRQVGRLPTAA